jgi:hypothetical protein
MTTAHAIRTLAELLPDEGEPLDFAALRHQIQRDRASFTEEELSRADHNARIRAASALEAAHPYSYELTDTFGGGANYSWVRRGLTYARSIEQATRQAKAALGLNGHRCRREAFGDLVALYPAQTCTVIFVSESNH